ncbi:DNA repair protein RadC [Candidatus Pacearchaeota archaeon]|nr:DNA repair protein RadC [Candidatus Pacearchaeota archaeon]
MKVKDLPEQNRPRERFLKHGPEALSDSELFAILLRTGTRGKKNEKGELVPGENVVDMSNRLIKEYGLDKLFDCSLTELQKIKGIGPAKAMQILTINEIVKRTNQAKNPIKKITCSKDVFNIYKEKLSNKKQEIFTILMLGTKNHILGEKVISIGNSDTAIADPKEILNPAIKNSASKIILIHNHPSGDPKPSIEDKRVTQEIVKAGEIVGIVVLDHIIIGKDSYWSWREKN